MFNRTRATRKFMKRHNETDFFHSTILPLLITVIVTSLEQPLHIMLLEQAVLFCNHEQG